MKAKIFNLDELQTVVKEFIEDMKGPGIFLFEGEMGSGKTTFISELCRQLGTSDDVGSPTFSLVNEYLDKEGNPIYHFDLYRIESPSELIDLGAEEYFNSGNLCLVEWPDRLGALEPADAQRVFLRVNDDGSRIIEYADNKA